VGFIKLYIDISIFLNSWGEVKQSQFGTSVTNWAITHVCTSPGWQIGMEHLVEWKLAAETKVLRVNLHRCALSTTNSTWLDLGWNPGRHSGKLANNRLSYGTVFLRVPRFWFLLEKSPVAQLLNNFPQFYGTWGFITVFTRVLLGSLSWPSLMQSVSSYPIWAKWVCFRHDMGRPHVADEG
jgi:hypothetical protein